MAESRAPCDRAPWDIAQLVAERRWGLLELHQEGMSLEEVFLRVVAGEEEVVADVPENGQGR